MSGTLNKLPSVLKSDCIRAAGRALYRGLWQREKPQFYEVGLLLLLVNVIRDSVALLRTSHADFLSADAFGVSVIGIEPVGFASFLPLDLVLSQPFERFIAAMSLASAILWIFKRLPRVVPICTFICYGLLVSLMMSRMANYTHRMLPGVGLLLPFVAFYWLNASSIRSALRNCTFWDSAIYPNWVWVTCICYIGTLYTYGGIHKITLGGSYWLSGAPLQILLMERIRHGGALARLITDSETIAFTSTILTVILEALAIVGLALKQTRIFWALGLITMHVVVQLTMKIDFKLYSAVLVWLCLPWRTLFLWVGEFCRRAASALPRRFLPKEGLAYEVVCAIDYLEISAKPPKSEQVPQSVA